MSDPRLADYEAFMSQQTLVFPPPFNGEGDGYPPATTIFDRYQGRIAQDDLWLAYWMEYRSILDRTVVPGLMARVYRIYPSLVRELHLYYLLEESGGFDLVLRDQKLDSAGVDYLILSGDRAFSVQAYIDTPRARRFRGKKRGKHAVYGIPIELPLNPDTARYVGPFAVYDERHIEQIRSIIEKCVGDRNGP